MIGVVWLRVVVLMDPAYGTRPANFRGAIPQLKAAVNSRSGSRCALRPPAREPRLVRSLDSLPERLDSGVLNVGQVEFEDVGEGVHQVAAGAQRRVTRVVPDSHQRLAPQDICPGRIPPLSREHAHEP